MWWRTNGLKVPNAGIIYENGLSYVAKMDGNKQKKMLVKIIRENEKYSIVRPYTLQELTELGFNEEEVNKMDKISLYDEIVINPNP